MLVTLYKQDPSFQHINNLADIGIAIGDPVILR